jgi:formylmethanofuran dehydrogenase subunit E
MKQIICSECGVSVISSRTGIGEIKSLLCPDCMEERIPFISKFRAVPPLDVEWFNFFELTPPPEISEPFILGDKFLEWRVCKSCKESFQTDPNVLCDLCFLCLEKEAAYL